MYGYVLPNGDTLSLRDFSTFQATYCGICLETKKRYGNLPRLTTNYDATFLALLLLESVKPKPEFSSARCIADPRKRAYFSGKGFMELVVDANILLAYYKKADDLIDGGKKSLIGKVLEKPYEKAKANLPEADAIISVQYDKLRFLERANETSLDKVSDCFARLLALLAENLTKTATERNLTGENYVALDQSEMSNFSSLVYNIGKFVYLADALDDVEEDYGKNYNPFASAFGAYKKRTELLSAHGKEISFAFYSVINRAKACLTDLRLTHVGDLVHNVVDEGLNKKAHELLTSKKKLRAPLLKLSKQAVKTAKEKK